MNENLSSTNSARGALLKWGGVALFLLWLTYCLTAYFVVHKPFGSQIVSELAEQWRGRQFSFSFDALIRTAFDLAVTVWITWIALGVGARLLYQIMREKVSGLAALLYSLALGFGALGLLTLLLGVAGLLQTETFYLIAILLTVLTTRSGWSLVRHSSLSRPSRLTTIYLVLTLGMALTLALLPPVSWDGLFYHLTGPKQYLEVGRIQPGIDIPHLNFPSLFEMLYLMAMGMRGDASAKLLHYVFNLMLAALVFLIARDHLKVKNSWTAVLFMYATPMVQILAGWAYNDLALAFYQVAAISAALKWRRTRKGNSLALSGVLCGLAMGLKYTSFIAPLFLMGVVIWEERQRLAGAIRPLLYFAVPALVVAAPWYIKNLFFTGNPVYPFLFDGRFWDEFRSVAYVGVDTGIGFDLGAWLRLPHDLTLGLGDASQDGPTGPFFLAFLPLLFFYGISRRRPVTPPALQLLLWFSLVQYLFWTVGVIFSGGLWQSRLLLPAFVALSPVLAWILGDLKRIDHTQFSLRRFLHLVIGLVLLVGLISQGLSWLVKDPLSYIAGNRSREQFLQAQLGLHYVVMEEMNGLLPLDAVVAFLWEPRSYYCDRDCRPDSILDAYPHLENQYGDAGGMTAAWHEQRVTHLLIHEAGLEFLLSEGMDWVVPKEMTLLQEIREQHLVPIRNWQDVYTLYRLDS